METFALVLEVLVLDALELALALALGLGGILYQQPPIRNQ